MYSLFKSKEKAPTYSVTTDIHSHLLPGLDDGVKTLEEAELVVNQLQKMGYKKIITTPHIMSDYYRNTNEGIEAALTELKEYLKTKAIEISIEAAAEYYLDEDLIQKAELKKTLLTFGKKFLLFETNYLTEPFQLKEFIFQITTQGYKPVLAHPERYQYMSLEKAEDLRSRGVLFQVNLLSLSGYYSKQVQVMANKLIDKGWVDLLGSDCHNPGQALLLEEVVSSKYYKRAMNLPLLNQSL